jgi:hypothetical protein
VRNLRVIVTLILCYRFGAGIMLLGDSGSQVDGHIRGGVRKVYRNATGQLAITGWGGLGLPFEGTYNQRERWMDRFVRERLRDETRADLAVDAFEGELRLPVYPHGCNGGFFIAGFLLYQPVVYELTVRNAAAGLPRLDVERRCYSTDELATTRLIRGTGYTIFEQFAHEFGTPNPQNHRQFVSLFTTAVRRLRDRREVVSGPVHGVFVQPRYPEAECEIEGSIDPRMR